MATGTRTCPLGGLKEVYDYIIIGAGTCGCILANRLTEDISVSVLIVEYGNDDLQIPDIAIPGRAVNLLNTDFDWQYKSVPQTDVFKGYADKVSNTPRGRGLGGSSSVNNMLFMRGTPHDYDTWENLGCSGWSYKDVLTYFKKMETCLSTHLLDSGDRGSDGPIGVTEGGYSPMTQVFIDGGKEMGYIETDCNGSDPVGFMVVQSNIREGVRQSTAECYLRPASDRPNLHIAKEFCVTKIYVEQAVARGVQILWVEKPTNQVRDVRARREVLLCAGAVGSPELLMSSGIGPKEHLNSLGIEVLADLPVGDNLQDHVGCLGLQFEINKPYSGKDDSAAQRLYQTMRAGFLAVNAVESMALVRSQSHHPGNPNPDIQLSSGTCLLGKDPEKTWKKNVGMLDTVWEAVFGGMDGKYGFMIIPNVTHPRSRGTIHLSSQSGPPIIDPKSFSDPYDIETLVNGIKLVLKLCETDAYKAVGTRFIDRVLPGYKGTPFTDEYWAEYARTMTFNQYHICGTCRMGRLRDKTTVVDPQLRVKGIDRLRVVDASIIPEITSANINAPCMMIAEKAADMIKGRYSGSTTNN